MTIELRPHQTAAVAAAWGSLRAGSHPVLQLPTGTGKSLVAAELAAKMLAARSPVWIVTHVQELVKQNADAFYRHAQYRPGLICSGLNRRDLGAGVTFGTVQSMLGPLRAGELQPPRLIIVDEVHRVPHQREEGSLYQQMFGACAESRRLGLSATPWRTDNGLVYGRGEQFWFDELAYCYTVPQAVRDGWLAPLVGVETTHQLDTSELSVSGDFALEQVAATQADNWLLGVAESLPALAGARKHFAVYCPTVNAAERAAAVIGRVTGWRAGILTGGMSPSTREHVLSEFKSGALRVLCSVDTITTGFDFPALDCIVVLRPTVSSNLWVQIQGRGTRLSPGKKNCLVLDYVGNYQRLGGVDAVDTYVRQGAPLEPLEAKAPPPREKRTLLPGVRSLTPADPMTGAEALEGATFEVQVHKVNCVALRTRRHEYPVLMVSYACTTAENARIDATAFINTEEPSGFDAQFFADRNVAVRLPAPAQSLQFYPRKAKMPKSVLVRKQSRYWNVLQEFWS